MYKIIEKFNSYFCLILVSNIHDDDDDDDDDTSTSNRSELVTLPKIDPRILRRISFLFDKQHLASFFALMKAADSPTLLKISNFFVTLMIRWPSKKTDLLNSMIYGKYSTSDGRSAISLLWDTFKTTDLARSLSSNQSIPNITISGIVY